MGLTWQCFLFKRDISFCNPLPFLVLGLQLDRICTWDIIKDSQESLLPDYGTDACPKHLACGAIVIDVLVAREKIYDVLVNLQITGQQQ